VRRVSLVGSAALVGAIVGAVAALLTTAFSERCGEPCAAENLSAFVMWVLGGVVAFGGVAFLRSRREWSGQSIAITALGLSVLVLAPAIAHHEWSLRTAYRNLEESAPVRPTTDFFHMAITTRAVFASTSSDGPADKVTIARWQRCLIGRELCDAKPRSAEVLCKSGVVYVSEPDWGAFALVPEENAPGVEPLASMRLCGG
jgi:hypothetical protein